MANASIVDRMFFIVKNDSFIKYQNSVGITRNESEKI